MTLCVSICVPSSQTRVTSAKSWSFLNTANAELRFSWKSFHLRQSFSEFDIFCFTQADSFGNKWSESQEGYMNDRIFTFFLTFAENLLKFCQTTEVLRKLSLWSDEVDPISFSEPPTQVNFNNIESKYKFSPQPNRFDGIGNIWVIAMWMEADENFECSLLLNCLQSRLTTHSYGKSNQKVEQKLTSLWKLKKEAFNYV